jgi:hypothetical protein
MKLKDITSRSDIGLVLNEMGLNGKGAEIGVAFGENAEQILSKSSLETLLLIDNWNYVPNQDSRGYGDDIKNWEGCFLHCKNRLSRFGSRAEYMRMGSADACGKIEDGSLDFVYIDGNHMSPYVNDDIRMWFSKVKSGGVFGGHDYYNLDTDRYRCDVKTAVDAVFKKNLILLPEKDSSWYFVKP